MERRTPNWNGMKNPKPPPRLPEIGFFFGKVGPTRPSFKCPGEVNPGAPGPVENRYSGHLRRRKEKINFNLKLHLKGTQTLVDHLFIPPKFILVFLGSELKLILH
jgi:hypothetical protein